MATQEIWIGLRWSIGGGVASTRSEGVDPQLTELIRTAQATQANRGGRHPRHAGWAGRNGQSTSAAPSGAVEDRGRTMAINNQLRACRRRSLRGLDKKTTSIRIEGGGARALLAASLFSVLVLACLPSPLMATQEIWIGLRWSIGGGVASTRSEGVGPQLTELIRTAQATQANMPPASGFSPQAA
jgi:hypothetical protein